MVNGTEPLGEAETSLSMASSDRLENSMARGRQGDEEYIVMQQKDLFSVAHLPSQVWLPP